MPRLGDLDSLKGWDPKRVPETSWAKAMRDAKPNPRPRDMTPDERQRGTVKMKDR